MRRPIINPAGQDDIVKAVNKGAVPQGAVAPSAIPFDESTWNNPDVSFEDARAMSAIPALANNEIVLQYKAQEEAARQFAANEEETRVSRETASFEQEVFNPTPVYPTFPGQGTINDTFNTAESGQQTVPLNTETRPVSTLLGPDGMPLPRFTVEQLAREEFIAAGQRVRQNDFAARISGKKNLDETLKYDYGIGDLTRARVIKGVDLIGSSLVDTTITDPKDASSESAFIKQYMEKINEGYEQDPTNFISESAASTVLLMNLVREGKILSGKGNKVVAPDSDLVDQFMDSKGFTPIDTEGTGIVAFHDEQGLVGIAEGSLGRRLNKGSAETFRQARGSDFEVGFDSIDAAATEEALIKGGFLLPGKFTVLNEDGAPSTKREDLSKEHNALFMTRKYFDLIKELKEFSDKTAIKADVQRYTDGSGKTFAEFEPQLRAKSFSRTMPPKEIKQKVSKDNLFTNYKKKYASAYRRHDLEVVALQAGLSSALFTYINTPPNQRDQLPPAIKLMAEAYAEQVKISSKELNLIDPSSLDPKIQKKFFNAKNKIQNGSKSIASASVTQEQIPTGHYVGDAVRRDPSTGRIYNMTSASNEQNSKDGRGSLKGHDHTVSRVLIAGKPLSARVINDRDYNNFKDFIDKSSSSTLDGKQDSAKLNEVAFMISVMRRFLPSSRTIPDRQLIKEFTVQDLKTIALMNVPLKQLRELQFKDPQNVELLRSNPEKTVLDINELNQINTGDLASALGFMMRVDPKSAGQQQQVISFVDKYFNSTGNTVTGAILSLPDLSSGSRVQASIYAGYEKGSQLVTNMGFMQDNTAAEVNGGRVEPMDQVNYTQENPRYMSGKTFLDKLDMQISDSSDNLEVDGKIAADVANLMTDAFNTTSATEYMDTMFKLGNMVLDYGMGILGSTDAITKAFDKMLDKMLVDPSLSEGVSRFREEYPDPATYYDVLLTSGVSTLLEVGNLGFSKALAGMAQASLMLGEPIVLLGFDNSLVTVGNVGRKPIYGETRIVKTSVRERSIPMESELVNDPGAAAENTFVDGSWTKRLPYSAAMQALAPVFGHHFERNSLLLGLDMADKKLGEGYSRDIILDGHDSLGTTPLRAIQQEHFVNTKAVKEVLDYKLPKKTIAHIEAKMRVITKEILESPTMTMGQASPKWSSLGIWFDMKFDELIREDSLELKGTPSSNLIRSRKNRLLKDKEMLKRAMDAGLWSPNANVLPVEEQKKGINVLGTVFKPEDKHRQGTFSVDSEKFVRWYLSNIYGPARQSASTNILSFGGDFERLVDTITDPKKVPFASWYK